MRIAICDDEKKFIDDFKRITDKLYRSLDIIVDTFSSGAELLKSFKNRAYDLVFLDIEMPGMDGITLAEKLREISEEVGIVFLTGHIEYAIQGYEVNALRYLTKPADESKVKDIIDRVIKKTEGEKLLWIKTDEGEKKIRLSEVMFIESQNQNVVINTLDNSYSVRGNMGDYEVRLAPEGFFRIHRGYLVPISKIETISGKEVIMEDGTSLPISRSKVNPLKDKLFSYVSKEAF